MKQLVTATIFAPSHNDIEQTKKAILNALVQVKDRMNNGSEIKIASCNAENTSELQMLMGQIKWFSLGKEPNGFSEQKRQKQKKRTAGIKDDEDLDDILLDL